MGSSIAWFSTYVCRTARSARFQTICFLWLCSNLVIKAPERCLKLVQSLLWKYQEVVLNLVVCIAYSQWIAPLVNLLTNSTKWSNTLKQVVSKLPTNWEYLTILWGWRLKDNTFWTIHKSNNPWWIFLKFQQTSWWNNSIFSQFK